MHFLARLCLPLLSLLTVVLSSCATSGGGGGAQDTAARVAAIAAEPHGDYYIGRRFHIERTHFWGYVRRPGESWSKSRLIVLNERLQKSPDRLSEVPVSGPAHGYDHNYEYRLWGSFTGRKVYDPNSNMILPEFALQRWELISNNPGYLFRPNERFNGKQLLRGEPGSIPGR